MTLWEGDIATTRAFAYMRERKVWDTFSHDETDSWGNTETTSSTLAWTTSGGSAANYDISGGVGLLSNASVFVSRFATAGSGFGDVEVTGSVTLPVVAAGSSFHASVLARFVDTSNHYGLLLDCGTGGTIDVHVYKNIAGSFTSLRSSSAFLAYSAGTTVSCRLQVYSTNLGSSLKGRAWLSTEDEPDEWTVEHTADNEPTLLLGGVGVRGFLGATNSNTLPVIFSFDDFTAYSAPAWIDITDAVLIGRGLGQPIQGSIGRATELEQINETDLSFALKNFNGWFTPDNVLSPYWPDWKTGTPIRWTETIGAKTFAFPDTWLEIPEVTLSFEAADDPELSDRVLHLNATDLLTRLKRAPKFVSSLAAYIVGVANEGALRAYWPLVDGSGSTYANSAGPISQDPLRFTQVQSYTPVRFDDTLINFGTEQGPPGDDSTAVEFTPTNGAVGRLANSAVNDSTPGEAGVATLLAWVYVPTGMTTLDQLVLSRDLATFDIAILIDPLGGTSWMVTFGTATGSDTALVGSGISDGRWHLIGGQVDFGTGDIALWVNDDDEVTGNTGGSGTSGKSLDRMVVDGGEVAGVGVRLAHVQLYIGDSDAFTHADFLAQYEVGFRGFGQQTVDQRIRAICNYAGFGDSVLDLEESDSLIQAPAFAGQRPGDLAVAAAATGGGILFTQGDRLVYHDRKHRFGL